MKVNDLYVIIRELKQITVLQANLLEVIKSIDHKSPAYLEQQHALSKLNKLIGNYDRYSK